MTFRKLAILILALALLMPAMAAAATLRAM